MTETGPYGTAAETYWRAGWRGIVPLPARAKKNPPKGFTGDGGLYPSYPDIDAWATGPERIGNIALRMPANVIGLDVDAYGDKPGAETLALAEAAHGDLPPTWRTTSRDDGISGIRLYRVPEGLAWPGEIGGATEIIQARHRYAIVWPSIHPEGKTYRWIGPDGVVSTTVPDPDVLPLLPEAWVEAYTGGALAVSIARTHVEHSDAIAWIAGRDHATATMCHRMERALEQFTDDLKGSAHNSTRDAVLRVARLADEGHHGSVHALSAVRRLFIADATDANRTLLGKGRRTPAEAVYEFGELVASGVGIVIANPTGLATCDCYGQLTGLIVPPTATTATVTDGSTALAPLDLPQPAPQINETEPDETETAAHRFKDGAAFILDAPSELPNIWGDGDESLWAEGEALMICGPPGVGKTTLTGQLVRGLLGLQGSVLGLPVRPTQTRVLYLAMDRPAQIARGLRRAFHERERPILREALRFWEGPPPGDVARHPTVLLSLAQLAEADVIIIDSIKDAAVGLSEDEVAAAYNRARQNCLANGVQVLELHHMVKRGAGGNKPKELADVYGSAWLTAGAGSVLLLWGAAGDPIVEMIHLKQPAGEVGPWKLEHDHGTGTTTVFHGADVLTFIASKGAAGATAQTVAALIFDSEKPTDSERKKAARKLQKLVEQGHLDRFEQARDIYSGGKDQVLYRVPDSQCRPNAATSSPESNAANAAPMPRDWDSGVNPNAVSNAANAAAGPMPPAPPSKGGAAEDGRSKPYPKLDCNACGEARHATIIETGKGYCPDCSRERGR